MPEPFARQRLTPDLLTTRTPAAHADAVKQFAALRSEGQFVPLSLDKQTVIFPGFDGGAEWGGSAVDIKTGVIYINSNDIAWTGGLTENKLGGGLGSDVYQSQCSLCHAGDRRGAPPAFPSLIDVDKRLTDAQITAIIQNGKGRMPSFPQRRARPPHRPPRIPQNRQRSPRRNPHPRRLPQPSGTRRSQALRQKLRHLPR